MGLNPQQYNTQYLLNARDNGDPINDAKEKYGVTIVEADVAEGEVYWKVIGIHHLLPRENFGNHNVFIEALDEQGQRFRNPIAWAGWTWLNRRPTERADPVALDKPPAEAAGNITMHFGQKVSVWIKGLNRDANDKSDRVEYFHTAHPDEPLPDGSLLNSLGHHSFYVVFQRTRKTGRGSHIGVIKGRLERGADKTVRLLQNNQTVAEQLVGNDLEFRFDNLPLGMYQLIVLGTDLDQDNIKLDAANSQVNLTMAVPLPTNSVIFGRVQNGLDRQLLLLKEGNIIARVPVALSGDYRFEGLPAGLYSLQIFQTDIKQDNIALDGTNSRQVNLVVPVVLPQESKTITHYLLFGPPNSRGRQVNLLLAANYILAFSITAGFSLEEAKRARRVTIIGEGISPAEQQAIRNSGSELEVLSGDAYDLENRLSARIRAGRAFGE